MSLAPVEAAVDGAGVKRMPETVDGLGLDLLDALTLLARDKVREGGLKLVGEQGLLPAITQHLMQAALEAEMEEHLAAEAERVGGRGARSGGNGRNGYRTKKVMSEVGPIALQVPRDRLGTFRPGILPRHARRTGALDENTAQFFDRGLVLRPEHRVF
ncbi:transposase (plasmid) [Streptomyces sp. NBC_00984]|uniref:transposase n=1 Tax=Streptomyces sp. NBC_00984 TaxID=2903700 RepID=UPI0038636B45|nr:transposase [Streptomyces sp. NBC_00984]